MFVYTIYVLYVLRLFLFVKSFMITDQMLFIYLSDSVHKFLIFFFNVDNFSIQICTFCV